MGSGKDGSGSGNGSGSGIGKGIGSGNGSGIGNGIGGGCGIGLGGGIYDHASALNKSGNDSSTIKDKGDLKNLDHHKVKNGSVRKGEYADPDLAAGDHMKEVHEGTVNGKHLVGTEDATWNHPENSNRRRGDSTIEHEAR